MERSVTAHQYTRRVQRQTPARGLPRAFRAWGASSADLATGEGGVQTVLRADRAACERRAAGDANAANSNAAPPSRRRRPPRARPRRPRRRGGAVLRCGALPGGGGAGARRARGPPSLAGHRRGGHRRRRCALCCVVASVAIRGRPVGAHCVWFLGSRATPEPRCDRALRLMLSHSSQQPIDTLTQPISRRAHSQWRATRRCWGSRRCHRAHRARRRARPRPRPCRGVGWERATAQQRGAHPTPSGGSEACSGR